MATVYVSSGTPSNNAVVVDGEILECSLAALPIPPA